MEECDPGRLLQLTAKAWPGGQAAVTITLEPQGADTLVTIEEDASHGPGRLVPPPVRHTLIGWRNVESLRRLAYLAERRSAS